MGVEKNLATKKRLIVLVPDCLVGSLDLALAIHRMAGSEQRDVLYLALFEDEDKILSLSRRMATMKAVTAGQSLNVRSKLVDTGHWLKTLQEMVLPGDRIVCQEEQQVRDSVLGTTPISFYLSEHLTVPVEPVAGFYHPGKVQIRNGLFFLLYWAGFLAILGIFTYLQIQVDQAIQGFAHLALLIISVTCEIGVVWAWHRLIHR